MCFAFMTMQIMKYKNLALTFSLLFTCVSIICTVSNMKNLV